MPKALFISGDVANAFSSLPPTLDRSARRCRSQLRCRRITLYGLALPVYEVEKKSALPLEVGEDVERIRRREGASSRSGGLRGMTDECAAIRRKQKNDQRTPLQSHTSTLSMDWLRCHLPFALPASDKQTSRGLKSENRPERFGRACAAVKVDVEKPRTTLSAKTNGQKIANDSQDICIVGRVCWTDRGRKGRRGGVPILEGGGQRQTNNQQTRRPSSVSREMADRDCHVDCSRKARGGAPTTQADPRSTGRLATRQNVSARRSSRLLALLALVYPAELDLRLLKRLDLTLTFCSK